MTTLFFTPISEDEAFLSACREYEGIWEKDGEAIIKTLQSISRLKLTEEKINVTVYEGVSFSGRSVDDAMRLRASYNTDVKKGTLIHELGHRLLFVCKADDSEEEHKLLNLFLYDVWVELYGTEFADMMVAVESGRSEMYKRAWKYALDMTREERQKLLSEN